MPTHERDLKRDEVCRGQDEASVLHLISSIMFESKPKWWRCRASNIWQKCCIAFSTVHLVILIGAEGQSGRRQRRWGHLQEKVAADNPLETPCAQISRRDSLKLSVSEHHDIATAGLFAGRDTK
jgi:hypothetical protein